MAINQQEAREPAEPGDVRYEITSIIEETDDPQMATLVETIDDAGAVIARDVFASWDDPYLMIEAAREAQTMSLEDRFDMYAERGL